MTIMGDLSKNKKILIVKEVRWKQWKVSRREPFEWVEVNSSPADKIQITAAKSTFTHSLQKSSSFCLLVSDQWLRTLKVSTATMQLLRWPWMKVTTNRKHPQNLLCSTGKNSDCSLITLITVITLVSLNLLLYNFHHPSITSYLVLFPLCSHPSLCRLLLFTLKQSTCVFYMQLVLKATSPHPKSQLIPFIQSSEASWNGTTVRSAGLSVLWFC